MSRTVYSDDATCDESERSRCNSAGRPTGFYDSCKRRRYPQNKTQTGDEYKIVKQKTNEKFDSSVNSISSLL